MDIGLQSCQATLAETPQHGIFKMGRLVLDSDMLVAQLASHRHDLGEPLRCFVPPYNSCRHDRDKLRDQSRIETIVLSEHTTGTGELTKLVRIDTPHRQPRREQGTDDAALVTAARLKADCGDFERSQSHNQLGPAGASLRTEKHKPSGDIITSRRSFATSMPQKKCSAIFVSLPC